MEFLRFGSSIPGSYWGCCAFDIIQDFNQSPDEKASIQLVDGDGGSPLMEGGELVFAGPTYRDIFLQRIRFGTFERRDMPNHGFLAILTDNQVNESTGKQWLALLKETGFEFIRTVCNSVFAGQNLNEVGKFNDQSANHLFGLFRNIGNGAIADPLMPPQAWQDLPAIVPEPWMTSQFGISWDLPFPEEQQARQREIWDRIGPPKLLKESEVVAAGAPVVMAGVRTQFLSRKKRSERE